MITDSFGGKLYECWSMVYRVLWFIESFAFLRSMKQMQSGNFLTFSISILRENS